jgi:hypothetical protein
MGWRWRQWTRIGPFKFVFSKSGVGASVGIPGLRYGVTARGRRFVTVGIPGLGLYWFRYLDKAPNPPIRQKSVPIAKPMKAARPAQSPPSSPWRRVPRAVQGIPWWKQADLDD